MVEIVDRLDGGALRQLADVSDGLKVSLIVPTFTQLADTDQVRIRLKNLTSRAAELLVARGMRAADARAMLEPVTGLQDGAAFRLPPRDGLALLVAEGQLHGFDLPYTCPQLVVAGDDFQLAQLLPLARDPGRFYVLALSKGHVALYRGSRNGLRRVDPAALPASLSEVLRYDDPERQLQWHTRTPEQVAGGPRHAVFHGHGVGVDDESANQRRLCERINDGLRPFIADERAPLVLAGVEPLLGTFRQVGRWAGLLDAAVEDNPALQPLDVLHRRALDIAAPALRAAVDELREAFSGARAHGLGATELETILGAAAAARIDTLLVQVEQPVWGTWDAAAGVAIRHGAQRQESVDLVNSAVLATLRTAGTVHVLAPDELPDSAPACALLRY